MLVTSRSYEEYAAMFDLGDSTAGGRRAAAPPAGRLIDELGAQGHDVEVRDVPYEFQRGARAMLVIRRAQAEKSSQPFPAIARV